jgi:hypothetical protein
MDITIRIKFNPATREIAPVPDSANTKLEGKVMVTTAEIGDKVKFVPDDPATEVVVFFISGPKAGVPAPLRDPKNPTVEEPMVLQNNLWVVEGPSGRYRYSCVVNTLSGLKTWPLSLGGGGEVDIPTRGG